MKQVFSGDPVAQISHWNLSLAHGCLHPCTPHLQLFVWAGFASWFLFRGLVYQTTSAAGSEQSRPVSKHAWVNSEKKYFPTPF